MEERALVINSPVSGTVEQLSASQLAHRSYGCASLLSKLFHLPSPAKPVGEEERSKLSRQKLACTKSLSELFEHCLPGQRKVRYCPSLDQLKPKRQVSFHAESEAGHFFSDKMQRPVQYESLLERRFLRRLEKSTDVVLYLEQPIRLKYWRGSKPAVYIPDVLISLKDGRFIVTEIKPLSFMTNSANMEKYFALCRFGYWLGWDVLITDGKYSFFDLVSYDLNPEFYEAIRCHVQEDSMDYHTYKNLESAYAAGPREFAAVLVQQGIGYDFKAHRLTRSRRKN